jgi:hypothetical protein
LAIFTGKILCECGKHYKRKNERGKFKWVCQGYDNYSSCQRNIVDEEGLKEFISRRLFVGDRNEGNILKLIEDRVQKIEIISKDDFKVTFFNEEIMYQQQGHFHY